MSQLKIWNHPINRTRLHNIIPENSVHTIATAQATTTSISISNGSLFTKEQGSSLEQSSIHYFYKPGRRLPSRSRQISKERCRGGNPKNTSRQHSESKRCSHASINQDGSPAHKGLVGLEMMRKSSIRVAWRGKLAGRGCTMLRPINTSIKQSACKERYKSAPNRISQNQFE